MYNLPPKDIEKDFAYIAEKHYIDTLIEIEYQKALMELNEIEKYYKDILSNKVNDNDK